MVRQASQAGLDLAVDGTPVLRLKASFSCTWDHRQAYLAVEQSRFEVLALADTEPLFRIDYLRSPEGSVPSAHLQVHAHRDAVSYAMTISGQGSRRGKRRSKSSERARRVPKLAQLHFRSAVIDFVPVSRTSWRCWSTSSASTHSRALRAIGQGRMRWRRNQLGAAVRDSPETAARILQELGYAIHRRPMRWYAVSHLC